MNILDSRLNSLKYLFHKDNLISESIKPSMINGWKHEENDLQMAWTIIVSTLSGLNFSL